jgi:surfactin synthase thioesterase subunit
MLSLNPLGIPFANGMKTRIKMSLISSPPLQSHHTLGSESVPKPLLTPLSCPITVFGGLQDNTVTYDQLTAWQSQTQENFSLHMLLGDHFFPNSDQLLLIQLITAKLANLSRC